MLSSGIEIVVNLWYYSFNRWFPFLLKDKKVMSSTLWVVSKPQGISGSKMATTSLGLCGHVGRHIGFTEASLLLSQVI